jgi:LacI family transcriptional regulator
MSNGRNGIDSLAPRATLKDVADRAGVALSTASRVLNEGLGRPEVRARVQTAARETGYRPHALARSLRTGATMTIGFVVPDIANPLYGEMAKGAAAVLGPLGYSIMLAISDGVADRERRLVETLLDRRVDGLIVSCSDEGDGRMVEVLSSVAGPLVLLDRDLQIAGAHRVLTEHRGGVKEAVKHLVELGHRRIAYVGASEDVRPARERLAGFREGASELGVLDERLVRLGDFSFEFGRHEMLRLQSTPDVTAVVAGGNQLSTGVLAALREAGRSIPDDISFVGCDDIDALALNNPPIDVIGRSIEELGAEAGRLVASGLADVTAAPVTHVVYSHLIVRRSSARPRQGKG